MEFKSIVHLPVNTFGRFLENTMVKKETLKGESLDYFYIISNIRILEL